MVNKKLQILNIPDGQSKIANSQYINLTVDIKLQILIFQKPDGQSKMGYKHANIKFSDGMMLSSLFVYRFRLAIFSIKYSQIYAIRIE